MTPRRVTALALSIFALAACTGGADASGSPSATPPGDPSSPTPATTLSVMTFNIEYGGTVVDFAKVIEAIRKSNADVVALNESEGAVPRIAKALGYPYVDLQQSMLSKVPLIDPPGADGDYTYVQTAPGHVAAIANVHLPSGPYSPHHILTDGWTRTQVLATERRVRMPALASQLATLGGLIDRGTPTFLVGDFNAPSRLDYTPATVGMRPQIRWPIAWPVSVAVGDVGFQDSYRVVHPDPAADPGLTWPSGRPRSPDSWNPMRGAPQDRIDFVYAGGPATATGSFVMGEPGGPGVERSVRPWPSDHRAVVSTFSVVGAVPEALVSVAGRVANVGEDLQVTFHGTRAGAIAIVPAGAGVSAPLARIPVVPAGETDGTFTVPTSDLDPGAYDAVLIRDDGTEIARGAFWLNDPVVGPVISTDGHTYTEGDPIGIHWIGAPGSRFDWVGVYHRGADPNVASYLDWFYTNATVEGTGIVDATAEGHWPLPPGRYTVYLLLDDGYHEVARADFTIRGSR